MKTWNPTEYLKGLHTRQLLAHLQKCRVFHGRYDVLENDYSGWEVTTEQVKAELATREHIPNKIEAKAIRQERARMK